jgi:DNA mismatch repair protein MutS
MTPMMVQWHACKKTAGDALLLFRMGDFYEAFYEDAARISKELDLTLTTRQEIPMAGIPFHTCDNYIDQLIAKGLRVAVAEQTSDPKASKGLVSREVVRIVTPGTIINSSLLSDKSNNFFASVAQVGSAYGLAFLDLTTADFRVIEFDKDHDLLNEIIRLRPAEFLIPKKIYEKNIQLFNEVKQIYNCLINTEDDWHFDHQIAYDFLVQHFRVHSLDGFGLRGMVAAINAAGGLLKHLQESLCLPIGHIAEIHTYSTSQYMSLDRTSLRNLELTHSLHDGSRRNTLVEILDQTQTPMGARLIHHWIKQPLFDVSKIVLRQDAVEAFCKKPNTLAQIRKLLDGVRDIERLMMKIGSGYATPRDLVGLRKSFEPLAHVKRALEEVGNSELLRQEGEILEDLPEMTQLIARALVDEPPLRISDGNIIREGFHQELDEIRELSRDSKSWIARYQTNLRDDLGIKTLKVGFNRMFGYYIEVSKGQADRMPQSFHRRQTLVNAERFISPELKEYEGKVLTAEERMGGIETELFNVIRLEVAKYAPQVLRIAKALAIIDCLHSFAEAARLCDYVRPIVDESQVLHIEEGRHPVIERSRIGEKFIANDTILDDDCNRLLLITGPNMAGKSTYLRQVALITIMAQMGSFVPVKAARIGLVDKVFTRIGASDDLSRGQSTFMVEMTETANILNNATSRSLVILDEIGRGTSTYDGISIAWSVAECLLTTEGRMAKTLFATHYWELTKLEEKVPGAVNYHVAVHESNDNIIFLRRIVKGGTDKSYGIHVGRLAGLPPSVIERAKEILVHLEENANRKSAFEPSKPKPKPKGPAKEKKDEFQLTFFG